MSAKRRARSTTRSGDRAAQVPVARGVSTPSCGATTYVSWLLGMPSYQSPHMTTLLKKAKAPRPAALSRRAAAITTASGLLSALAWVSPAQAVALSCAADAYEADSMLNAAPIAVGGTLTRAICQDPSTGSDIDWFAFDAPGGIAYSAGVISGGSAL